MESTVRMTSPVVWFAAMAAGFAVTPRGRSASASAIGPRNPPNRSAVTRSLNVPSRGTVITSVGTVRRKPGTPLAASVTRSR